MTAPRKPADHKTKTKTEPRVPDPRGKVEGKIFTWTDEDEMVLTIPLRIKMKILRSQSNAILDADGMFSMIEAIAPDQSDIIDEMDVNSFMAAFTEWQSVYNERTGATLGESSDSST
jgi:phage FluMu protein gp41